MLDENSSQLEISQEISRLSDLIHKKRQEEALKEGKIRYRLVYDGDWEDEGLPYKLSPRIEEQNIDFNYNCGLSSYTDPIALIDDEIERVESEIETLNLQISELKKLRKQYE